jgi:hypothetical protein
MRIRKNKEGRTFETYIGWPLILVYLKKGNRRNVVVQQDFKKGLKHSIGWI